MVNHGISPQKTIYIHKALTIPDSDIHIYIYTYIEVLSAVNVAGILERVSGTCFNG